MTYQLIWMMLRLQYNGLIMAALTSRLSSQKQLGSIRYSHEVLDYFRYSGAGWESRVIAVLRE